ncbi:MAG: COX15/CtaA family protein, partial [Myxococcales bacterium]|nr:COX15/CtaA family protein [Myxococcales bacterium]
AGCGSHWPTCNGEIIPQAAGTKTVIELTHRVTSGLSALMVFAQVFFAFRLFERGHRVRKAATWAGIFMVIEVLIGAGIVLLRYVEQNASIARAIWMAVHLCNTFLLVGAMALTAHFAAGRPGFSVRGRGASGFFGMAGLVGTIVVGMSGAVAALGDTLFPASTLGSALAQDLSPTAHLLVRLRVVHPFVAVLVAFMLLTVRYILAARHPDDRSVQGWGLALRVTVVAQMLFGLINMMLLAPTSLQLVHLTLAQALWVALVLFLATSFAAEEQAQAPLSSDEPRSSLSSVTPS